MTPKICPKTKTRVKEQQVSQIELYNNPTRLIGFVGRAQSGKMTSCSYLAGLSWQLLGLVNEFFVNDQGLLVVKDLKGNKFPRGKHLDVLNWNNDEEINSILEVVSPHPMNIVQKVAFADPMKQVTHLTFGIEPELLWGDDKAKGTETQYTANDFIKLIGAAKFPYKEMNGNDKLTVRQILCLFGTDVCRRINENIWVDRTVENIYRIIEQWRPALIVVEDVRHENEIKAIQDMGGICIGLTRKPRSSAGTKHSTEQSKKYFNLCDFVVDNADMDINSQCLAIWEVWKDIITSPGEQ